MADLFIITIGLASIVVLVIYYALFRKSSTNRYPVVRTVIPLDKQSTLLRGPERIRAASWGLPNNDPNKYLMTTDPNVTTMYENFLRGKRISNNGECLGYRETPTSDYSWLSYGDVLDKAHALGSGLVSLGAKPGQNTFVAIYAQNCPDWSVAALAATSQSMVIVPLYDTLGPEATVYIVNQAQIEVIICDSPEKVQQLLKCLDKMPSVKHIIVMKPDAASLEPSATRQVQIHSMADTCRLGRVAAAPPRPPKAEDIYIICYTSGTTGDPKGVMLQHDSLIAETSCFERFIQEFGDENLVPQVGDTSVSYLPLAHMFEQMVHAMAYFFGGRIGFFGGNIRRLPDDLKTLRPMCVPAVPRVLNRVYDGIMARLEHAGLLQRVIFWLAYHYKLAQIRRGIYRRDTWADKLVFGKVQNEMGGNVMLMFTGSAPIAGDVLTMCRVAFGCLIFEGYGQTECTAGCSVTVPNDLTTGHVGPPIPACQIKLVDVPELDYFAKDDKGEICVRGPIVMKGYFKEPAKTAETIDADGWLHSGDIGVWLPNGSLKIVDRKKHIFKLAQGEYVAPEKIEAVYMRYPMVDQILVEGNSLERFLVGIMVPHEKKLRELARELNLDDSRDFEALCQDTKVVAGVLVRLQAVGKANKLNSIEQVQALHLSPVHWSMENGLLTPTLKTKRPQLRKLFQDDMDRMYVETNKKK